MIVARQVLVLGLAWAGALLTLVAAIGLLRMPDLLSRLQVSSKAPSVGVSSLLLALALHFGDAGLWLRSAGMVGLLFLTAPIAAHLIARAGFVTGTPLAKETAIDPAGGQAPGS
jgi:multicomponent Na+:H+ antiporter subunit G